MKSSMADSRLRFDRTGFGHIIDPTTKVSGAREETMETAHLTAPVSRAPARSGHAVRPLSRALGAEITGGDLRDPGDEALTERLLDTWHAHLVILLRDQILNEDDQVRFAERFGPPAKVSSQK